MVEGREKFGKLYGLERSHGKDPKQCHHIRRSHEETVLMILNNNIKCVFYLDLSFPVVIMYTEIGIDNPSQWELVKVVLLSFSGGKQNLAIQSKNWGMVYQKEK